MYCITATHDSVEAADTNDSCVTISQFANSDYSLQTKIILILQPGNHSLDSDISISNISIFIMQQSQGADTTVLCERQAKFIVEDVSNVSITGLKFKGCGGNIFSAVDELIITNSMFIGIRESHTALILNGTTSTSINQTIFMSNNRGSYLQGVPDLAGGAIIVKFASQISVHESVFVNNSAGYGGAIYAEVGSTIILKGCRFMRNDALFYGSVIFASQTIISISSSQFSGNRGSARSRSIFLIGGAATISLTNFTYNSDVIIVILSKISIEECNFSRNSVTENEFSIGLLSVDYGAILLADRSAITMTRCEFYENDATETGGIIVLSNAVIKSYVLLLTNNKAYEGALVMTETNATFKGTTEFRNNIGSFVGIKSTVEFSGFTTFFNNTSSSRPDDNYRGGALTVYFGELHFTGSSSSVVVRDNFANTGGAFFTGEAVVYISSKMIVSSNVARYSGGGIFTYQTSFFIYSNVLISDNEAHYGGGVYAVSASITVSSSTESAFHSLELTNNTANFGGGLYFTSYSRLYLFQFNPRIHNITVSLRYNCAQYGGAVYINDENNIEMCTAEMTADSQCSFQVIDFYKDNGILQLHFESNTATISGSLMFGGLLDRCDINPLTQSSFFNLDLGQPSVQLTGLSNLYQISNIKNVDLISSLPVSVCFCIDNQPDCSVLLQEVEIQKGRKFSISVAAVDHTSHPLNATILTELLSTTGGLGDGQQSQNIDDQCRNLSVSVTSLATEEKIVIFADGPCGNAQQSVRNLHVVFSECTCPIGFDVDPQALSTCECICSEEIRDFIQNCTIETSSFKKGGNSWIDYETSGFIISHICPYDYCLPFDNVEINLNTSDGADSQCANNRAGILCGSCQPQYSLSLGQSGCLKCDHLWPLYTILIVLATLITGILLVSCIICLNLTVTAGTINGFIFSANILKAIFPFPSKEYPTYLISSLNLDVTLNVCYYDGYDAYVKAWLEIAYPVLLFSIVFIVIFLGHWSARFARLIGKRNPVETLATLIFLSYAKLLQFTITALSFGVIEHPNGQSMIVWLPDAHIQYFKGKHIPMFIVAVIVLFAVLVYTLVLFFWQWLLMCPNWRVFAIIRNTKLRGFFDMYHVPNNNRHRYWTGLLLLLRLIIYVITVSTTSYNSSATHLAIITFLSSLFVIKSFSVRVYRKWPLDVLESVLIVNTIIVTAVSAYALNTDNPSTMILIYATICMTTAVMATLLVGVNLYHLNRHILKIRFDISKRLKKLQSKFRHQSLSPPEIELSNAPKFFPSERNKSILDIMGPPTDSDYICMEKLDISNRQPTSSVV